MSDTAFHREVLQQGAARADARTTAHADGYRQALEELTPQVEKLAADAVASLLTTERDAEVFRGQVAAHAAGAFLDRAKVSMQNGFCWDCGVAPPSSRSRYRRCATCDTNDQR